MKQMESIGQRLERLLDEQNMTQRELAHKVGVTEVTIGRYVKDTREPKGYALADIAQALNTSTDYLLGRTDKKYNTPEDFPEDFTEKDKEDVITRIQEIYNDLENQEMLMLSASQPVDAITKEMLKSALASAVTIAKAQQKEDEKTSKRPEILNALEELKEIKNKE